LRPFATSLFTLSPYDHGSYQTHAPILEAFCNGAKAEVGLINAVQVYCYTDTRIIKAFPQLVKVFYNTDVVSDQAIIYWHQKGAKPQGKQHFLKATEPFVNVSDSPFLPKPPYLLPSPQSTEASS